MNHWTQLTLTCRATGDRIYQASDLASSGRKAFIADALRDRARLRSTDGEALVMLREARFEHVAAIRDYAVAYLTLETAMRRHRDERRTSDYGAWAFINAFDDEDIEEFLFEVNDAIVGAAAGGDHSKVDALIHQWRMTARTLSDQVAVQVLSGTADESDWVEVGGED